MSHIIVQEVQYHYRQLPAKKVWSTTVSELDTFTPCSPAKKDCSLNKINGNYALEETKHSGLHSCNKNEETTTWAGLAKYKFSYSSVLYTMPQ